MYCDSDGSINGGDEYGTRGAFACLTIKINRRKLVSDLAKIPETGYSTSGRFCDAARERLWLTRYVMDNHEMVVCFVFMFRTSCHDW